MDYPVNEKTNIIFIGGTGRCGTNITKEIFSKHPRVATLPFEYRFIIDPDGIIDFYNGITSTWSPYIADQKLKRLEAFLKEISKKSLAHNLVSNIVQFMNKDGKKLTPKRYFKWELNQWIPNFETHSKQLMNELKDFDFRGCWPGAESYSPSHKMYHFRYRKKEELAKILEGFINTCIGEIVARSKKEFFMEDNTWNILFARELLALVPDAKIIHVYRDPRDVIASFMRQRWSPSNLEQATSWYLSIIERWLMIKKELPKDSYIEIKLEDLVSEPESTLKAICHFIALPFDEVLLTVDLGASHVGRWRAQLSKDEKSYLENNLKPIIKKLNYD